MISEGSYDTEVSCNGCWQFSSPITGINGNILQYYLFCCIFDQINAALVNIRIFFQKHYCLDPKLLNGSAFLKKMGEIVHLCSVCFIDRFNYSCRLVIQAPYNSSKEHSSVLALCQWLLGASIWGHFKCLTVSKGMFATRLFFRDWCESI